MARSHNILATTITVGEKKRTKAHPNPPCRHCDILKVRIRPLLFAIACAVLPAHAQDGVDDTWKNLLIQGTQLSADKHDNAQAEQVFMRALHEAERFGQNDVRVGAT